MGNVGAFAEQTFALRGEPTAISDSAQVWARFADTTDTAAGDLRALDAEDFQGDEADTYRGRLNGDLPPYLDTASQAWNIVGGALRSYAAALADLQSQMSSLRSTAWSQWQSASAADAAACRAEADDRAHTADRLHQADALEPGQKLPADTYRPAGGAARSTAASTSADYTATLTAADQLRSQHTQAVNTCADAIDRATALRFADPPSWIGHLWEKASDWVADHIDILQTLSAVLKQISSIAATLAMIPILAPLAGPVAAGAGMLALGIDTGIKITTGHGNWTDIALTGMSFIPGAKAALATDLLSTGNDAAHGDLDWTQLAATAAFGAAGGRSVEELRDPLTPRTEPSAGRRHRNRRPHGKVESPSSPDATSDSSPDAEQAIKPPTEDLDVTERTAIGPPTAPSAQIAPSDDPNLAVLLRKRAALPTHQQHLLDFNPDLPGVPTHWQARVAENGNGWIWQDPTCAGTERRVIRIMGPVNGTHPYPSGMFGCAMMRVNTEGSTERSVSPRISPTSRATLTAHTRSPKGGRMYSADLAGQDLDSLRFSSAVHFRFTGAWLTIETPFVLATSVGERFTLDPDPGASPEPLGRLLAILHQPVADADIDEVVHDHRPIWERRLHSCGARPELRILGAGPRERRHSHLRARRPVGTQPSGVLLSQSDRVSRPAAGSHSP